MKIVKIETFKTVVTILLIGNLGWVIFLLLKHLNFLQIDHAGHIASAVEFGRTSMHQFSDRIFLGYTHGLFYPPLEDFLINEIHWISHLDYFVAYRIYLIFLVSIYFLSILRLLLQFKSWQAFSLASFGFIFLLNMAKAGVADYQGMSMVDLFITGLSNQLLSGVFFFVILKEVLKRKSSFWVLLAACTLGVLSHIVVGFVCVLISLGHLYSSQKLLSTLKFLLIVLCLTAFYTIPFAAYSTYQVHSAILGPEPWLPFLITAAGLVIFFKDAVLRLLFFISVILFSSVTWVPHCHWIYSRLPLFHYSRFTIIAFMLTIAALAQGLEFEGLGPKSKFTRWTRNVLALGIVFWMCTQFQLKRVSFTSEEFASTTVDFKFTPPISDQHYGRYFVPGPDRGCDSGLESILSAHDPHFRSTKGLFWESSSVNTLQTSFLATLLSPPMALDYFYYYGYSCEVQKCYLDRYFSLYNVKGWVGNFSSLRPVSLQQKQCYQQILNTGTQYYQFEKTGAVKVDNASYSFYELKQKNKTVLPDWYSTEAVEALNPNDVRILDTYLPSFQQDVLQEVHAQCKSAKPKGLPTYLRPEEAAQLQRLRGEYPEGAQGAVENVGILLKKISDTEFEFNLPNHKPTWFLVKLSSQPGMRFLDSRGKELPLLRGYPHTIGIGSGKVRVVFERPRVMKLSYLLSLFSLVFCIILICRRRFRKILTRSTS